MPFVSRDESGKITGVSDRPEGGAVEEIPPDHPELLRFLADQGLSSPGALRQLLAESDLRMVRLVDDLVDLLIDKGVIKFTDLPQAAGEKYMQRQAARKQLQAVADLMVGEKDII
jgi:hypothetical protein